MSVTHCWLGAARLNLRWTRSSKVAALTRFFRCVRRGSPASPSSPMGLCTVFLEMAMPNPSCSSARTRLYP